MARSKAPSPQPDPRSRGTSPVPPDVSPAAVRRRLTRRVLALSLAAGLAGSMGITTLPAQAEPTLVPLPQSDMSIVEADSTEGANVPEHVLDGEAGTIWHTAWRAGKAPLPHHLSVRIAADPVEISRVRLLPSKDSNGSGRIGDYDLFTSQDPACADGAYTKAASGSFGGELADAATERAITLESPVTASCVKVVWKSAWGGKAGSAVTSPPEQVASLAEFNVDVVGEPSPGDPIIVDAPEGAPEISEGDLHVRLHPDFPQVVDYRLGDTSLAGRYGAPISKVSIDDVSRVVEVAAPELSADGR